MRERLYLFGRFKAVQCKPDLQINPLTIMPLLCKCVSIQTHAMGVTLEVMGFDKNIDKQILVSLYVVILGGNNDFSLRYV